MKPIRILPVFLVVLAACSQTPVRPEKLEPTTPLPLPQAMLPLPPVPVLPEASGDAERNNARVCRQVMHHDARNYRAGGLYAPDVADAHPDGELDIHLLKEPIPRQEAKSRAGNRSPYKVLGRSYYVRDSAAGYKERGVASWYGTKFHGRATSSGEIYDMCQFSAAHKTLPVPSYARVTRLDTGQSVIVRINDRGPFHDGRLIDLSFAAASKLGINRSGVARVEVEAITVSPTEPVAVTAISEGTRYLQVAAFSSAERAESLKGRLRAHDIVASFVQKARTVQGTVWRVRIGPLDAREASKTEQQLQEIGLQGVRVGAE